MVLSRSNVGDGGDSSRDPYERMGLVGGSLAVRNVIAECDLGKPHRERTGCIDYIVIHQHGSRLSKWPTPIDDAVSLARAHAEHPELAGVTGRMPYHFVVRADGIVEQAVGCRMNTPHARRWNNTSVAVAVLGDFNVESPTSMQWQASIELATSLCSYFALARVVGHHGREPFTLPGSSSDKTKVCPGEAFPLERFIKTVGSLAAWCEDPRKFGIVV